MKNKELITVERLQFLYAEIAKVMMSSLDTNQSLNQIMQQVESFFQPKNWSLFRLDSTTNALFFYMAKGIDKLDMKFKLGEGIVGMVAKTGKSIFIEDASTHPAFSNKVDHLTGFKTKSLIAVPIKFQNQVLGVIELINTHLNRKFTENEFKILETIADFGAIALKNSLTHEQALNMAMRDPLTGVYNRASLNDLFRVYSKPLRKMQEKRDRDAPYLIVTYIDVDKFKEVNDQNGHVVGDLVLQKMSKILLACCRSDDYVFRIGGDEFILLIMHLQKEDLSDVQESITQYLTDSSKEISPAKGFSFGIAAGSKSKIQDLIELADQDMYKRKQAKQVARVEQ